MLVRAVSEFARSSGSCLNPGRDNITTEDALASRVLMLEGGRYSHARSPRYVIAVIDNCKQCGQYSVVFAAHNL